MDTLKEWLGKAAQWSGDFLMADYWRSASIALIVVLVVCLLTGCPAD